MPCGVAAQRCPIRLLMLRLGRRCMLQPADAPSASQSCNAVGVGVALRLGGASTASHAGAAIPMSRPRICAARLCEENFLVHGQKRRCAREVGRGACCSGSRGSTGFSMAPRAGSSARTPRGSGAPSSWSTCRARTGWCGGAWTSWTPSGSRGGSSPRAGTGTSSTRTGRASTGTHGCLLGRGGSAPPS